VTKFHFSPRPNRAHEVNWREWGEDAFAEAKETGKPLLLALSAVWCHWCHVMDETSYSDAGVIAYINEHFVPVRVDNDQRPDVNARYNMGGWPTTAFLSPEGEILAGATYIPPDQMKEAMPKVFTYWASNRDEVRQKAIELREKRAAAQAAGRGELSDSIIDAVLRSVVNAYDPLYGGFGDAPKFPHTDALDLLMYAHLRTGDPDLLHMARKTLEMMFHGEVYDREWNGFFRYATRRDWSEPHYEKMLEDNAGLLRNALLLRRISGNEEHAEIARGIVEYVEWKLRDREKGYFYGSQDADEEFYKLTADQRKEHEEPYIDRTCYVGWNAQMISAYLEASWTLDRDDLSEAALAALEFLWSECRDAETGSMYRYYDGAPHVTGLLGDQAQVARALLDAAEATGEQKYNERAAELTALIEARFRDADGGGFFDVWDAAADVGRLRDRQKSVQENALCAEVFTRLYHLTREERYGEVARTTLEAFAAGIPQMGYFAAGFAKQADLWLHPPAEVNIVGEPATTEEMRWAALSLYAPFRIVQVLEPERDAARLAALSLPAHPSPAAYVCVGTACSAPVTDADSLIETVRRMSKSQQVSAGD
jgi:uncharacterized protein YyaL (SSP411 family)